MTDTPDLPGGPETPVEDLATTGRRKIGLAAIAIMLVHFLARFGGLIQKIFLARFFGTGMMGDAATAMQRVFEVIYYIPEELLTHSLLPVFTKLRREEGESSAWRMASITGTIQAVLLVAVTLAAVLFTEPLVWLFAKGFQDEPEKFALTVDIVRVAMLGLFCTSIGSLTYVLLNAYKRFVTPALGDVAQKAGIIIGPQADRPLAAAVAQYADHAGLREPGVDLQAERGQPLGDVPGRRPLLERGLGVGVQVVAPVAHLRLDGEDFRDEVHGGCGRRDREHATPSQIRKRTAARARW